MIPTEEQTERTARGSDHVDGPSVHRLLTGSHRIAEYLNAVCERAGVTLSVARALQYLAETRGTRTPTQLARTIGRTPASVSELIKRMLRQGYMTAEVDPDDRRSFILGLTEQGHAKWAEVRDALKQAEEAVAGSFGPSEFEQVADGIERLAANLEAK